MAIPEKLRASKPKAMAAKDDFLSQYARGRRDRAVGIGVNRDRSDWAMKVYASTEDAAFGLPERFQGFEVDVEVTGVATAQAS